jgi:hypothetical protein
MPPFLTTARDGGEPSASRPCHFNPGEAEPDTHCTGGWVGLRAGLDNCGHQNRNPAFSAVQPEARCYTESFGLYPFTVILQFSVTCLFLMNSPLILLN